MTLDDPAVDDSVEPLQDPTETPWSDEPEPDEPPVGDVDALPEPLTEAELATLVQSLVEAPFALAGSYYARQIPPAADAVRELWTLAPSESLPIATNIARALPDRWRRSRLLASSPLLVAGAQLAAAVQVRVRGTAAIAAEFTETTTLDEDPRRESRTADPAPPPVDRRAPRPRDPRGRFVDRAVPGESTARSAPLNPDGWEGGGLGA